MKQIKWVKNPNGWGARVGIYYIDVKMKVNKFRIEVYFGKDFISGINYKVKDGDFILPKAVEYFFKTLDGRILDRYLQD